MFSIFCIDLFLRPWIFHEYFRDEWSSLYVNKLTHSSGKEIRNCKNPTVALTSAFSGNKLS